MTDTAETLDYSKTLYLPETDFPMRAGLPQKEPETVARREAVEEADTASPLSPLCGQLPQRGSN